MIPSQRLSTTPIPAPFLPPDDLPPELLTDYELGGIALRDPSQGLQVQVWTATLVGADVTVSAPSVDPTVLFSGSDITELRLAFDQNMNPCIAYVQAGQMILYWFDTFEGGQVFTPFDGTSPQLCLDDKRTTQRGNSDIIFAYIRAGGLYFRAQRDRFGVEYFLTIIDPGFIFTKMGMNAGNRLQFAFDPVPV